MVEDFKVKNGTHPELRSFKKICFDGWETKNKKETTLILNILKDFEFIIGIITLLSFNASNCTNYATASKKAVDVVSLYTNIQDCILDLDYLRNSVKDEFSKLYQHAVRMGMKLSVTPLISRTSIRQEHRNNIPSKNPEKYYERAITIPPLDILTQEIKLRFTKFSKRVSRLLYLVPSVIYFNRYD